MLIYKLYIRIDRKVEVRNIWGFVRLMWFNEKEFSVSYIYSNVFWMKRDGDVSHLYNIYISVYCLTGTMVKVVLILRGRG